MAKEIRSPFSINMDFRVMREFTFDNVTLKPGRPFNWRALGASERLVRQLYEQRKLEEAVTK